MRIPSLPEAQLGYCLNVHPGGGRREIQAALAHAADVWRLVATQRNLAGPYGVGGWFAAASLPELDEGALRDLARELHDANLYYFTLNGFPYGVFHGTEVKTRVYQPDWAQDARRDYTLGLIDRLAALLPQDTEGSISTLPVAYRSFTNDNLIRGSVKNLALAAFHCRELRARTGQVIRLALEPEPDCLLDDLASALEYFNRHLLPGGTTFLRETRGLTATEAEACLREYLGICLDTVHAAVLFESPTELIAALIREGIRINKIQLGAAIAGRAEAGLAEELRPFADPVYLHQTCIASGDNKRRYPDLPPALAEMSPNGAEWRVHFHVPLAWQGNGTLHPASGVDAAFLRSAYAAGVRHFEVEIYTLGVMPGAQGRAAEILAGDLCHMLDLFAAAG